jgi:hypothetical protein
MVFEGTGVSIDREIKYQGELNPSLSRGLGKGDAIRRAVRSREIGGLKRGPSYFKMAERDKEYGDLSIGRIQDFQILVGQTFHSDNSLRLCSLAYISLI